VPLHTGIPLRPGSPSSPRSPFWLSRASPASPYTPHHIKSNQNVNLYKQGSQRSLLRVGTVKKPRLRQEFKTLSTNVTALQFRRKVVPHRWCRWAEAVLNEMHTAQCMNVGQPCHYDLQITVEHDLWWCELEQGCHKNVLVSDPKHSQTLSGQLWTVCTGTRQPM